MPEENLSSIQKRNAQNHLMHCPYCKGLIEDKSFYTVYLPPNMQHFLEQLNDPNCDAGIMRRCPVCQKNTSSGK